MSKYIPNVLSIAGSDPSGGAGVQADLKTFGALGCYGMAAITALTAQNTVGVSGIHDVPKDFVYDQIDAIFRDIRVDAIKIGMLAQVEVIEAVADVLDKYSPDNIVLDPVMVATSGDPLITSEAILALKQRLVPLADVITPNIPEAQKLSSKAVLDMERSALDLLSLGCEAVYLKGGHLKGENATDVLAIAGGDVTSFSAKRIDTDNTHGTGCTLSSAIASFLAKGMDVKNACDNAKKYLSGAIAGADVLEVGLGRGPVNHFYNKT